MCSEEYAQFYGAMNTMNGRMVTMRKDGLPYEDMGYVPPPNRWGSMEKIKANVVIKPGFGIRIQHFRSIRIQGFHDQKFKKI
jgi:hypothetical protein